MSDLEREVKFVPLPGGDGDDAADMASDAGHASEPGNGRVVELLGPDGSIVHLGSRQVPVAIDLTADRPGVEWEVDLTDDSPEVDDPAAEADQPTVPRQAGPSKHEGWPLESHPDISGGSGRRRLPLLVRIGAPVLAVVLLAALAALYARSESSQTGDLAAEVSQAESQYQATAAAEVAVTLARLGAIQGITDGDDEALDEAAVRVDAQLDALADVHGLVETWNVDNDFTKPLTELLASDEGYLEVTRQLVTQAQDNPDTALDSLNGNREFFQQRQSAHAHLRGEFASELNLLIEKLDRQRGDAGIVFPVIPAILLLIGAALAWWAWRSIVTPLRHVAQTLDWIAQGQFRVRSNVGGNDDLGRVGQATDRLAEQLGQRFSTLSDDARRSTQNRVITEALEIADSLAGTLAVVEQALGIFAPELPGELLLVDPDTGTLGEAAASPTSKSPGCPVVDPAQCFALRRGQTVVFDSSESINSCPMLKGRPSGPISAVCVPLTFNSAALGVVHVTAPNHLPPETRTQDQFIDLATQTATHIGTLRTLEVTRQQASTDTLTGLANRRVIEARAGQLLRQGMPFVLVLADLDRFKAINDRFGHEVGDRALQAFAAMLTDNVRGADVVGRLGGEEFIIIYPELSVAGSMEAIERLRLALSDVTGTGDVPTFTASFGVTHSSVGDDFDEVVRVADAGLLMAKEQGRDRAIYATPDLAEQVFDGGRTDQR